MTRSMQTAQQPVQVSLIIATLDDNGDLAACLESATHLIDPGGGFELVIVDQNPDDRLTSLIQQYAEQLPIVYRQVDFRGANRARNLGAQLASGDWLAFPDDDCRFLPDTLIAAARHFTQRELHVITGQIINDAGQPVLLRWPSSARRYSRWTMFHCVTEATLFVRRTSFETLEGFDCEFGPGAPYPAAEGIELLNRLFQRFGDACAQFDPAIALLHPEKIPPWNAWACDRYATYAVGDGAVVARHPHPHMWLWAARTLVAAGLQTLLARGWKRRAYDARIRALAAGYNAYRRRRPNHEQEPT